MVSRLYPSTRKLWEQTRSILIALGVGQGRPRRLVKLMALYVAGLMLLEKGQTAVRITTVLPARAHDALNRLLRTMPWSPQRLLLGFARWIQQRGKEGYLCLDDVIIEKPFAKLLPWVGWTYSYGQKRHVYGFHIVLVLWCCGHLRIPVGFCLWRPKREGQVPYRTKLELAQGLLAHILRSGLRFEYLAFDSWYNARWFTKWLDRQGIIWVSMLRGNAKITYRGQTHPVEVWGKRLPRHRIAGCTCAWVGTVHLPDYGSVRLVVATNGHGNLDYVVSNDLHRRGHVLLHRKRSRWEIETSVRDTKQLAGLGACQCRMPQAMERHVALALLAFVVLQQARLDPSSTVGEAKRRLHLSALRGEQQLTSTAAMGSSERTQIMAAA